MPNRLKQNLLEGSPRKKQRNVRTPHFTNGPMAHPGSHRLVVAEVGFNEDLGSIWLMSRTRRIDEIVERCLSPSKTTTALQDISLSLSSHRVFLAINCILCAPMPSLARCLRGKYRMMGGLPLSKSATGSGSTGWNFCSLLLDPLTQDRKG